MADQARSTVSKLLYWIGWPLRQLLLILIKGYRRWISPGLPSSCKYHPSCSSYAVQAVEHHGAAKGFLLASGRLARCNPFSDGGVNPIPEHGHWRAPINTDGTPRDGSGADEGSSGAMSGGLESRRHPAHDENPARGRDTSASQTESTTFLAPGV